MRPEPAPVLPLPVLSPVVVAMVGMGHEAKIPAAVAAMGL
jgi:hypothetical protein